MGSDGATQRRSDEGIGDLPVDHRWHHDPTPYQQRIRTLLGDRDPMEVVTRTPEALARIAAEHPAQLLRRRPREGVWTPNEILGHLADAEWAHGWRLRRILSEDRPRLEGFDQEGWVRAQRHDEREPRVHVEAFTALRGINVTLLRQLSPDDRRRAAIHEARGPESLDVLIRLIAGHDLWHLDQLRHSISPSPGRSSPRGTPSGP